MSREKYKELDVSQWGYYGRGARSPRQKKNRADQIGGRTGRGVGKKSLKGPECVRRVLHMACTSLCVLG